MTETVVFTHCDVCGRRIKKAERIHNNERYCATCYARTFKRRLCPKCRNFARLPKNDLKAVCRKCDKDKPCVRCGKTGYRTGKITPYGPVCSSCAPHFNEPKPCPLCGKLSRRLTRVKRLNINVPVCPKCASHDYGTCPACGRYRLLLESTDGRHLCKKCLENGEILCPSCGKLMSAGKGNMCNECYWQKTLRKRLKMDVAGFAVPGMAIAFSEFGEWLLQEAGSHKAALTIHRYLPFFMEIEKQWKSIPVYSDLLARFGAEGLRRVRLPMRWLAKAYGVVPNNAAKEEDSDRRRIEAIMVTVPAGTLAANALDSYKNLLIGRVMGRKMNLRSARLSLRPAASLLITADNTGEILPTQGALDKYLRKAPGQKAAVTGFINHLNKAYRLDLVAPVDKKRSAEIHRKRLESELVALLSEINDSDEFRRKWISTALAYFHQLSKRVCQKISYENITVHEDHGFTIALSDRSYWVPRWDMLVQ